ncbi:MAG: hypothetical protein PF638_10525 [Candidatus Delongbacteria bacterium]|jgi:hypothetical protein|nr:hypothetical protein [Candidatus Delongbacteria bacterium]
MFNKLIIFLLLMSAVCFPADFFNYIEEYNENLYSNEKKTFSKGSLENKWYLITDIYYDLYRYRLGANIEIDHLEDKIDNTIDFIEDDKIKNITNYEKELIISLMYGIKCYISSTDISIGNLSDLRKSYKLSEEIKNNYKKIESLFGFALTNLVVATYFENSFWIKDIFGYEGNIGKSIEKLNKLSNVENLFNVESNIAMSEFYTKILLNHRASLKYTRYLNKLFSTSKYFKFLYSQNLYHTGQIDQAFKLFKEVNTDISNEFYPFEYSSLIYEIKCLYLLDRGDIAVEVLNYTKQIHEGYLINELDKWKYSLKRRKNIINNFEKLNFKDLKDIVKNEHDKKLTMNVLFDHGYFEELFSLINYKDKPEFLLLYFRSALILEEYKTANQLFEVLESNHEEFLDDHQDVGRILLLKNILDNILSN